MTSPAGNGQNAKLSIGWPDGAGMIVSNLETTCGICGKVIHATIGGGVPRGSKLDPGHTPSGSHEPTVRFLGKRIR